MLVLRHQMSTFGGDLTPGRSPTVQIRARERCGKTIAPRIYPDSDALAWEQRRLVSRGPLRTIRTSKENVTKTRFQLFGLRGIISVRALAGRVGLVGCSKSGVGRYGPDVPLLLTSTAEQWTKKNPAGIDGAPGYWKILMKSCPTWWAGSPNCPIAPCENASLVSYADKIEGLAGVLASSAEFLKVCDKPTCKLSRARLRA